MNSKLNTKANRQKQFAAGYKDGRKSAAVFGDKNELGTDHGNLDRAYRKGWFKARGGVVLTPAVPEIITTGRAYTLLMFSELKQKEREELDYVTEDTNSFFRYQGSVYDLGEFARIVPPEDLGGQHHPMVLRDWHGDYDDWDCYQGESAFSMMVVRYKRLPDGDFDPERIVIGRSVW